MSIKKIFFIFITAFLLNTVWEHLHSLLYIHYKGGEITNFILFRATLFDAVFITVLIFVMANIKSLNKTWFLVSVSVATAILIEIYALSTGRWAYGAMPVIPIINTGLTPTVQLAFLGYITKRLNKIS
ncbi:MAG: hypothetical protein COV29_01065 [Candidatus Yanofskybacteria bacterium CG10_big_fil_rev_8_21_14_0_10_36_16]|uniref:Uncharacterized protein n=1 Tax=Candidatus Yanofskybacteria bacterium CG10_big_fil_rev_8_21_14_0_10_36_16 TaxID=1975096 RepID=A0A2J0Q8H2_9BACT|nr:MAG: hypothetical protein COV29_01065 [Candidatus Yanofskybacteria bacterium CG10_big_fil_rev_8_21_14_0_10_36_16]